MTDLITRLRSRLWQNSGDVNHWFLRDLAAEELEQLYAERERLRAELNSPVVLSEWQKLRAAAQQAHAALRLHSEQYPHMQKGYTVDALRALDEVLGETP